MLGATDYWFRKEFQHRGSVHVHGVVWLPKAPNVDKLKQNDPEIRRLSIEEVKNIVLNY